MPTFIKKNNNSNLLKKIEHLVYKYNKICSIF